MKSRKIMMNHSNEEDLFWARRIVDSKDHNGVTPYNQRISSNEEVSNKDKNVVKMHEQGDEMKKLRGFLMSINVFGVIICTSLLVNRSTICIQKYVQ